jgi:hypothetical protein
MSATITLPVNTLLVCRRNPDCVLVNFVLSFRKLICQFPEIDPDDEVALLLPPPHAVMSNGNATVNNSAILRCINFSFFK